MDIKEIAERVSKRIYVEDGLLLSKFISEKFAEALIAELAKGNEHIGAIQNGKFQWNTDGGPEKWRARKDFNGKLYTFPPTAEQIANETAEACALQVATETKFHWLDAARVAKEIRSGEWRKHMKGD